MMSRLLRSALGVRVSLLLLFSLSAAGQTAVTTYHNDNYRSGVNARETVLTPSNVDEVRFGKRLVLPVEGYVYSQPLYVPGVSINGIVHNVVYVATEHDQVYAFDANTGKQLWNKSFVGTFGNR
jgi:PQQ enzyme repeat